MRCSSCGDEYVAGLAVCPACEVALVPEGAPLRPTGAPVGRFHPAVARHVAQLAGRRGLDARVRPHDHGDVVLVDPAGRDAFRAELVMDWAAVVGSLEDGERDAVQALGGTLPGWFDAPNGAWVDRDGRLRVADSTEDEAADDEGRYVGPGLVTIGLLLGLFAWYVGDGELRFLAAVLAVALVLVGVFTPR